MQALCVVLVVVLSHTTAEDADVDDYGSPAGVWTDQEMTGEQIRVLHRRFDTNNDGKVSLNEILDFSKKARKDIKKKSVKDDLAQMDENNDGKISVDELIGYLFGEPIPEGVEMPSPSSEEAEEERRTESLKAVEREKFKLADKDGDGFLAEDELLGVLNPDMHDGVLHVQTVWEIKDRDKDGDGMLSFGEFWEEDENSKDESSEITKQQTEDFKNVDLDGNGKVDIEEYKKWHNGDYHTSDAFRHLMELADENRDGHLTADELDEARPSIANTQATSEIMQWLEHYEL